MSAISSLGTRDQHPVRNADTTDPAWRSLYIIGGAAALIAVLTALLDILLSVGAEMFQPGTLTAVDWFARFQGDGFAALRDLGILNIVNMACMIPVFLALYASHRHTDKAYAALAMILYFIGAAIYVSNNAAVPMYVLSDKYAAAATDVQRSLLASAGEAVLAQGEDFTPGFFVGFISGEIAIIAISVVMLRSGVFSKATAYAGIVGLGLLAIFTVWTTFFAVYLDAAMLVAMVGGLLSIAWLILVAWRLFQLARGVSPEKA